MNPYRKQFKLYLAFWLLLALTPAAFAVLSRDGFHHVYSTLSKTWNSCFREFESPRPKSKRIPEPPLPFLEPGAAYAALK